MKPTPAATVPRGFSLIELLVSMAIGLVLTLAITSVMKSAEGTKRSTTSVNDTDQGGAFAAYTLDRVIRSAGSGYAQRWREVFGCTLVGSKSSTALNFRSTVWTDAGYGAQKPVLAPVLIGKDQANTGTSVRGDLLTVMAGTAGYAEAPQAVTSTLVGSPPIVNVANSVGYQTSDLVLIADPNVSAGCMVEQLGLPPVGASAGALPISGTYATTSGTGAGNVSLSSFGVGSFLAQLGSADTTQNNAPEFITYGVTDNNVLSAYELLQVSSTTPTDVSDGVVEMHALYGIDTINGYTGSVKQWVDPTATSGYDIATLLSGNQQARLRNIIAIRVGLILRTSLPEKDPVAQPKTLTLFADLPAAVQRTRTLTGSDLNYRFRKVEMTVPLRNVVLAP